MKFGKMVKKSFMDPDYYIEPVKSIWQGRQSEAAEYIYQQVHCAHIAKPLKDARGKKIGLLGYCCDEGVRRNQGRVGAKGGPDAIRKQLAKLSRPSDRSVMWYDLGNVICHDGNLEKTSDTLRDCVSDMLAQKAFPVILGGGHDIVWGHYKGIRQHIGEDKQLGIINLDAHFDLRPDNPKPHSGSAFYQILSRDPRVKYLCLGVNDAVNPESLYNYAEKFGVEFIPLIDMNDWRKIAYKIRIFIEKVDYVYLTVDMDCFSAAHSPGVSAPAAFGLDPEQVIQIVRQISLSENLISIDMAELNPVHDIDDRSARLAAQLIWYLTN